MMLAAWGESLNAVSAARKLHGRNRIGVRLPGCHGTCLAVSSLRKEFAVVLGVESRDRRRIDFRMVQACLHSGVPSPL